MVIRRKIAIVLMTTFLLSGCVAPIAGLLGTGGVSTASDLARLGSTGLKVANLFQKGLPAKPKMHYLIEGDVIRIDVESFSKNTDALSESAQLGAYMLGEDIGCQSVPQIDHFAKKTPPLLKNYHRYYFKCSSASDGGKMSRALGEHSEVVGVIQNESLLLPFRSPDGTKTSNDTSGASDEQNVDWSSASGKALIKEVQSMLLSYSFDIGVVDGIAGKKTSNAIRSIQKLKGWPVNGTIDKNILSLIE